MKKPEIPFTIFVLAPFGGSPEARNDPILVETDLLVLNEAMKMLNSSFRIPLPREVCPKGGVDISITELKGFRPENIVKHVDYIARLVEAETWVENASKSGKPHEEVTNEFRARWADLPVDLVSAGRVGKPSSKSAKLDNILDIVDMSSAESGSKLPPSRNGDLKSQIERILSLNLKKIFEDDTFRSREAAWRGLEVLLKQGGIKRSRGTLVKMAAIDKASFESVLTWSVGEMIAEPPNLTLVDLPFDNSPRSIELLQKLAWFSENLMTPTIAWVNAGIFNLQDWRQLGKLPQLGHHLEDSVFSKWRKLRGHSGAEWIALTCNRFLGRLAYGPDNRPKGVMFREERPCWLSPVWATGALIAKSVEKFGWPNRFTDFQSIHLSDLPLLPGHPGPSSTEMQLSEDRLHQFVEEGFSPLVGPIRKDVAFMPKETCVSGDSFRFRLLLSRVLGFLFWCQENLDQENADGDLAGAIQRAFALQWQKTGHLVPDDLKIVAQDPDEQGFVPLSIELTPPASVFSSRQKLAFGFRWSKRMV